MSVRIGREAAGAAGTEQRSLPLIARAAPLPPLKLVGPNQPTDRLAK